MPGGQQAARITYLRFAETPSLTRTERAILRYALDHGATCWDDAVEHATLDRRAEVTARAATRAYNSLVRNDLLAHAAGPDLRFHVRLTPVGYALAWRLAFGDGDA